MSLEWLAGREVLVAGWGISARALVEPLQELGAQICVTSGSGLADAAGRGLATATPDDLLASDALARFALVITSPGWPPTSPLLVAAAEAGIPVWGDVEFSWQVDQAEIYGPVRRWLVVTGTNGKTTTTAMLASILEAANIPSEACGNIGIPILEALRRSEPRAEVLAVELSSFQLHWAPSVHPEAGVVLNIAEDHLDWHGGMEPYIEAKARALTGKVGIVGLDDANAAALGKRKRGTVGFRLGEPEDGELGVWGGQLLDRAFGDDEVLAPVSEINPPGPAGVMDALAAAALARSIGVAPSAVRNGLRNFSVGPHRATLVRTMDGIQFVDDSKATNPHAARSSILAHSRVVWVAGGLLKGASVDELVAEIADRLVGVVLIGRDASEFAQALARHAPDVPVVRVGAGDDAGVSKAPTHPDPDAIMAAAVTLAARFASSGDTVLLAPAAASLDMFTDYGHRGDSFADAVRALSGPDVARR